MLWSLVPSRIAVFAELIVAVGIACWLAAHTSRPRLRWLVALVGVVALFPDLAGDWWNTRPDNPTFFQTTAYQHHLKRGENVLVIPFGQSGDSMLWQAETGFYFKMPGGYISSVVPTDEQNDPGVGQVFAGSTLGDRIPVQEAAVLGAYLRTHHITHIVMEPQYQAAWTVVLTRLASPPQHSGGMLIYTVR